MSKWKRERKSFFEKIKIRMLEAERKRETGNSDERKGEREGREREEGEKNEEDGEVRIR